MRRFVMYRLVFGFLPLFVIVGGGPAIGEEQPVIQADHALAKALQQRSQQEIKTLLDPAFEWTDADGATKTKNEIVQDPVSFAKNNESDADVKVLSYDKLAVVSGTHHDARFVRIWAKQSAAWRLLIDLDTPTLPDPSASARERQAGDCDNPCRTVPYSPKTAADKAVLSEWQKTKVDEWHPDADDWATHIANEFMLINNGSARNRTDRVETAKKDQAAGISLPGAPILSMKMIDIGNTVLMITHHVPYQGGKPYYNVRVFVNRDGHWPLVWSQQTTIQAAQAMPPVNAKW